jgi:IclR family transcriptional regulator, pca regulon regulatory protein
VKLSERTLIDLDALLARLEEVRARGYAVSDGENAYGLLTVAAPVLDPRGAPCAGVSLTVGAGRMSVEEFAALAAPQAQRVAAELGEGVRLSFGAIGVPGSGGR